MTSATPAAALLPCPFCGCADIFVEPDERGSGGQRVAPYHVGCTHCKAEQFHDDEDEARYLWNRRAAPAPAAEPNLMRTALQMLYDETADYIRLNNLGGMDNQCMRLARQALAAAPPAKGEDGADVGNLEYRGNSVSWWHTKAKAYGDTVLRIHQALAAAGYATGQSNHVEAMLRAALAAKGAPAA